MVKEFSIPAKRKKLYTKEEQIIEDLKIKIKFYEEKIQEAQNQIKALKR